MIFNVVDAFSSFTFMFHSLFLSLWVLVRSQIIDLIMFNILTRGVYDDNHNQPNKAKLVKWA